MDGPLHVPRTALRMGLLDRRGPSARGAATWKAPPTEPGRLLGLLFDAGDLLFDASLWLRWLTQLLGKLGAPADYHDVAHRWDRHGAARTYRGQQPLREALCEFLRGEGLAAGRAEEAAVAALARRRACAAGLRALPMVQPTLARLAALDVRLGVLCNAAECGEELAAGLARLGLGGCFQTVITSCDVGRTLPDPACYRAGLAALHLAPGEAAFVGHDPAELAGAQAAGLTAIALGAPRDAPADVTLDRIELLTALVLPQAPVALAG